ncbi:putative phosphatidate phosphatase isoform X2 [Euwallacea fornicatus]|uniref:putative phosphatidate phosphatase isoform X2 n=1 Tax=Euwallacea fornicatus TaxID=995702 RepID=UPI00338FC9F1
MSSTTISADKAYVIVRVDDRGVRSVQAVENKAMVSPLQTTTGVTHQQGVRISISDPEKSNATQVQPSRVRLRRRIKLPYVINAALSVFVLSIIILLELGYIPATKTGFFCQDPTLSFKFTGDTINTTTLLVGSFLIYPLSVMFLTEYARKGSPLRICLREIWYFYKEFATGCALTLLITEMGKALVGEHRPHFFDVCQPSNAENCTLGQYVSSYECTSTKYSRYFSSDTSRSFPSGHSSLSVFVALYCAYILQARLPTSQVGYIVKPFLISLCVTWGLVCSLTRITDKRHHWWDVAVGMLVGSISALYSTRIIYKQLKQGSIARVATSTTTLLDIKNKDAKSEII